MTDGPYRFVRHPRYASILLLGLGTPLAFASILGWPLGSSCWSRSVTGSSAKSHTSESCSAAAYDAYARRTARLLPGVY